MRKGFEREGQDRRGERRVKVLLSFEEILSKGPQSERGESDVKSVEDKVDFRTNVLSIFCTESDSRPHGVLERDATETAK